MTFKTLTHYKILFVLTSCLSLISACSSTDTTPGTEVHTHLTHLPTANSVTSTATPGKQFDNNQGVTIELTAAYLTLSEMDLRTDCSVSPFAWLLDTVYELVVPAAQAHTESTPTKLGTPLVVNLLNADNEELEFGHFSPPPNSYCGITVHMHPADADAINLPTTPPMVGLVLHLEGNYDDTVVAGTFSVDISVEPEHADIAFPATIVLSESNLTDEIHLNIEYNTWFDGFDAAAIASLTTAPPGPAAVAQLLDNIAASINHD